jgi:hypothetical protein
MDQPHRYRLAVVKQDFSRFRVRMKCPNDDERVMGSFKRMGAQYPMRIAVVSGDELPHFFPGRVFQNTPIRFFSHGVTILYAFEMSDHGHEWNRPHHALTSEESVNRDDQPSLKSGLVRDGPAPPRPFS